jgi:hypothetical protein
MFRLSLVTLLCTVLHTVRIMEIERFSWCALLLAKIIRVFSSHSLRNWHLDMVLTEIYMLLTSGPHLTNYLKDMVVLSRFWKCLCYQYVVYLGIVITFLIVLYKISLNWRVFLNGNRVLRCYTEILVYQHSLGYCEIFFHNRIQHSGERWTIFLLLYYMLHWDFTVWKLLFTAR